MRPRCAIALALAACGGSAAPPRSDQAAHIANIERGLLPPVLVRGEDVRFSLEQRMRELEIPGLGIAVFDHGALVWAKGYGVADAETGARVTDATLFQAASISKPVNAAAVLLAAQRGALNLDAPINDALKNWKLPDNALTRATPVTLRQLLSHTGGTTVHGFAGYAAGAPLPTVVQILSGAPPANSPAVVVDLPPGTEDRYSGGGVVITQLALTDQLGRPYAEIVADTVLRPVGMARSTFAQPLPADRVAEAAAGHVHGKAIAGKRHVYPEQAAAGLWTTPTDLARFFLEVQRARAGRSTAIPRDVARTMTSPVSPALPRSGVGFALRVRGGAPLFTHNGGNFGFECTALASLDGEYGMVIMTNAEAGARIFPEIERAVFAEYGWAGAPVAIERARLAAPQLARATGRFGVGLAGAFTVAVAADGTLALSRPFGEPMELVPVAPDAFVGRGDGARYQLGAAGATLARTDDEGNARVFTRIADDVRVPLIELAAGRLDAAVAGARALQRTDPTSPAIDEGDINQLAYDLLRGGKPAPAILLFRFNAELHPESANALDSLGDGYAAAGDKAGAITSYEAALAALPADTKIAPDLRAAIQREATAALAKLRAAP